MAKRVFNFDKFLACERAKGDDCQGYIDGTNPWARDCDGLEVRDGEIVDTPFLCMDEWTTEAANERE
jgi:hypothetical protein